MIANNKLTMHQATGPAAIALCLAGLIIVFWCGGAYAKSLQKPPSLVGMQIDQARKILKQMGYNIKEHPYATVLPGQHKKVIAQRLGPAKRPLFGSSESRLLTGGGSGDKNLVEVWYYDLNTRQRPPLPASQPSKAQQAPEEKRVIVPLVMGLPQNQASVLALRAGLRLAIVSRISPPAPSLDNTIAQQAPMAGTSVPPNSQLQVTLYENQELRNKITAPKRSQTKKTQPEPNEKQTN